LNDSVDWSVALHGSCERDSGEKWGCEDWDICQNANRSYQLGVLMGAEYVKVERNCIAENWDENLCGFQIRKCLDVNRVGSDLEKPLELRTCYFSFGPDCSDGLKNCHDNGCEVLVDCGGPCGECETCSDGVKNLDEEGVDCGGVCREECAFGGSVFDNPLVMYLIFTIFGVLILVVLFKVWMVLRVKRKLEKFSEEE